jgi:hypothetical protein
MGRANRTSQLPTHYCNVPLHGDRVFSVVLSSCRENSISVIKEGYKYKITYFPPANMLLEFTSQDVRIDNPGGLHIKEFESLF